MHPFLFLSQWQVQCDHYFKLLLFFHFVFLVMVDHTLELWARLKNLSPKVAFVRIFCHRSSRRNEDIGQNVTSKVKGVSETSVFIHMESVGCSPQFSIVREFLVCNNWAETEHHKAEGEKERCGSRNELYSELERNEWDWGCKFRPWRRGLVYFLGC